MLEPTLTPPIGFVARALEIGRARFLQEHSPSLLVIQTPVHVERDQLSTAAHAIAPLDAEVAVIDVCKRPGANAFPSMVTIGRAPTNDLCLAAPCISRFHAYVTRGARVACLVDAGSTTGTFYMGQRLLPNTRVPLHSGGLVGIYLSSEDFYDLRVAVV